MAIAEDKHKSKTQDGQQSFLADSLASATSSIVSRLLTHPLDTAKARLQVPTKSGSSFNNLVSSSEKQYKGIFDVIRRTYTGEGIKGLYRGFGVILVGGTPGTMLYLGGYNLFKEKLRFDTEDNSKKFLSHFLSGILAETVACIIYVPVDVIKERLQVQSLKGIQAAKITCEEKISYKGSFDAAAKILKYEGMRGIYKVRLHYIHCVNVLVYFKSKYSKALYSWLFIFLMDGLMSGLHSNSC